MNFFLFASSVIFFVWLGYKIKKSNRAESVKEKGFWELESEANNTRRKSLDDLDYIRIPFDDLPIHILTDNEQVAEYLETLRSLSENPIVNLSCISNTDLKLRYGAPNITILSRYDSAYTVLARTLQQWAVKLNEAGFIDEARVVLEFAVSTKTDVGGTYVMLAEIYRKMGTPEKIDDLVATVEELDSSFKNGIIRRLREFSAS